VVGGFMEERGVATGAGKDGVRHANAGASTTQRASSERSTVGS